VAAFNPTERIREDDHPRSSVRTRDGERPALLVDSVTPWAKRPALSQGVASIRLRGRVAVFLWKLAHWACDRDLVLDRPFRVVVFSGRDFRYFTTVGDDLALDGAGVQGDYLGCAVGVVHERLVSARDHGHD